MDPAWVRDECEKIGLRLLISEGVKCLHNVAISGVDCRRVYTHLQDGVTSEAQVTGGRGVGVVRGVVWDDRHLQLSIVNSEPPGERYVRGVKMHPPLNAPSEQPHSCLSSSTHWLSAAGTCLFVTWLIVRPSAALNAFALVPFTPSACREWGGGGTMFWLFSIPTNCCAMLLFCSRYTEICAGFRFLSIFISLASFSYPSPFPSSLPSPFICSPLYSFWIGSLL